MEKKLKLITPWVTYFSEMEQLFKEDPAVKIEYDDEKKEVKLFVEGQEKADALTRLLPAKKNFGDVILKITVIPANDEAEQPAALFRASFENNPAVSYVAPIDAGHGAIFNYVVFKKEVVQFWNGDLSDINGNTSTLYQDVAVNVFGDVPGVLFCTDNK